jgi:AcrR family transcriptional regulator
MNEKFSELSEPRRQRIINGALCVFARYDYKKASTDEIAKAAGISKSLIFHYFGSKKELYLFLYKYAEDYVIQQMSALHDFKKTDFFDIISDAQLCKLKILSVYPDIMLFLIKVFYEENPEVHSEIDMRFANSISENSIRFLERTDASKFKDGITVSQVLNIVVWMSDGYMRSIPPEKLKNLAEINSEFQSYLTLFKNQFYKPEFLEEGSQNAGYRNPQTH